MYICNGKDLPGCDPGCDCRIPHEKPKRVGLEKPMMCTEPEHCPEVMQIVQCVKA